MNKALTPDERRNELTLAADAVEAELERLPERPGLDAPYGELTIWQRRIDGRVTEVLEQLGSRGATYRVTGGDNQLRYLGVRASCTEGARGVLRNWAAAARRKAEGGP